MKLSDLDLDIPSMFSKEIKDNLIRGCIKNEKGISLHPAGVYFYKSIPAFDGMSVIDYKDMESFEFQKIDILNNTFLDGIDFNDFNKFLNIIDLEDIDWSLLWEYENPYQLSNYPFILREFKVQSVFDVAIVLSIIRPGALQNYEKLKRYMHTDTLLKVKSDNAQKILKETFGIPVFDEQFKKLGVNDDKYRYKKPHAIGYAYVLLVDFLKNVSK